MGADGKSEKKDKDSKHSKEKHKDKEKGRHKSDKHKEHKHHKRRLDEDTHKGGAADPAGGEKKRRLPEEDADASTKQNGVTVDRPASGEGAAEAARPVAESRERPASFPPAADAPEGTQTAVQDAGGELSMSVEETNRYALAMQPVERCMSCVAEHVSTYTRHSLYFWRAQAAA